MSSFCGLPTEVWRTESTTFPTLLELPSNFIVSALFKTNGCGLSGGPIATQGLCFWWWVKSNSQQNECTTCTESKLASSCAALLLCSRCQLISMSWKENKQSIKCRFLSSSINVIVLWPPHRSLEHRIYDFSNPGWAAVKLHCLSLAQD